MHLRFLDLYKTSYQLTKSSKIKSSCNPLFTNASA